MVDTGVYEAVTGYPAKAIRPQVDDNPRRDFFVRLVLPVAGLIALACLLFCGCAHEQQTKTLPSAVLLCRSGLATMRIEAERVADRHSEAAAVVVAGCRSKLGPNSTEAQRAACVQADGMGIEAMRDRERAFTVLAAAYDEVVSALAEIDKALPVIEQSRQAADRVIGGQR